MGHGKYDDASFGFAVNDGERKALEEQSPGICCRERSGTGKGQCAGRSLFDRSCEASAKSSLLLVVIDDLGEELTACCQYEPG